MLAAGCADLRWHKDGADDAALQRDLDECTSSARAEAASRAWPPGIGAPRIAGVDARGRAFVATPARADADRVFIERDLERFCMTNKGYKLEPAEKQ